MLRFEVLGTDAIELETVVLSSEVAAGTIVVAEEHPTVAVELTFGAFRLQYRFEAVQTGLADFTVLWLPATQRLFLGGKRQSCVVNVLSGAVEHRFEHCLFWSFSEVDGGVLESGELDCLLRGTSGEILAHAPVDPPWEMHPEPEGYRFESLVHGTTWLRFPKTGASPEK